MRTFEPWTKILISPETMEDKRKMDAEGLE
jgi:hypothetical protein